jgi:hypothetical protein
LNKYCVVNNSKGLPVLLTKEDIDLGASKIADCYIAVRKEQGKSTTFNVMIKYNPVMIVFKTEEKEFIDYTNLLPSVLDLDSVEFDKGYKYGET